MRTIEAAQFKAQCLALLDELESDDLLITRSGKPVAQVVPYARGDADLIGSLRGKVGIKGDISTTGVHWNADAKS
jgi:prevent-host-death family protein